MGTLPPTPNLGLVLPNPGTGQPFSTATQNGWFTTIDDAIGDLWGMADPANGRLRAPATNDVSLVSTAHGFQIGPSSGSNLRADSNEIMSVNNGVGDWLGINSEGGDLKLGDASSTSQILGLIDSKRNLMGGAITINVPAINTTYSATVNFGYTMPSNVAYRVAAIPITSSPHTVFCSVSNKTATGFDIFLRRSDSTTNTGVEWVLIRDY